MIITVPCELFSRMAEIPAALDPERPERYLQSMYFERKDNQLFCVVSNGYIAAIEYLRHNDGPDEFTAITVDRALIEQCDKETKFNSNLEIVANPALNFTAIKTTFGYNFPGNAMVTLPADSRFSYWRKWFPDTLPTETDGAMYWGMTHLYQLATACKSGAVSFPEFIDASKPVVINDAESSDWVGLFMPNKKGNERALGAIIPDWI